jgi:hypothetical protein
LKTQKEGRKKMKSKQKQIEINKPSDDGYRWIGNIGTAWRFVGFSDDLTRSIQHKGWYTDNEIQYETFRGVVYKLPSRERGPVYFVGYADPNNEDAARGEIRTDLTDDVEAANAADDVARVCAESEREYQDAWRIGQQYAETFEVVEAERETRSKLFAELRTLRTVTNDIQTPTICSTLKSRIADTRRNIKSALKERRDILKNYYIQRSLLDAFADGASITLEQAKELF